jgi:peptidoglycan LD-endopeptidase LytH
MLLSVNLSNALPLDFSATNPDLAPDRVPSLDLTNTAVFSEYVFGKLREAGAEVGIGGYNEHRVIYRRSEHFNIEETEPREIHLGVDIWAEAGTLIFTPKDGFVHSFQDNNRFGDYGPTIILQHNLAGKTVYSLYGHLTRTSLEGLYEGKPFRAGEKLAEIGPFPENGDWPPHLHFQLITDLLNNRGDFPGVCSLTDREFYLGICPDPMSEPGFLG